MNFSLSTILSAASIIIVAGFGIFSLFDKKRKELEKEIDEEEKRVIAIKDKHIESLTTDVAYLKAKREEDKILRQQDREACDKEIAVLRQNQLENVKEIAALKEGKKNLTDILQGRDGTSQKLQEQSLEAIKAVLETRVVVTDISKALATTQSNIERMLGVMEKNLNVNLSIKDTK